MIRLSKFLIAILRKENVRERIMNKKAKVYNILMLALNLALALCGIVFLLILLKENERTYHVFVCSASIIIGATNSIRIVIELRKNK